MKKSQIYKAFIEKLEDAELVDIETKKINYD